MKDLVEFFRDDRNNSLVCAFILGYSIVTVMFSIGSLLLSPIFGSGFAIEDNWRMMLVHLLILLFSFVIVTVIRGYARRGR